MWADTTRAHMLVAHLALPSDLSDAQWAVLEPFLPAPSRLGHPRKWRLGRITEAILYLLRAGCPGGWYRSSADRARSYETRGLSQRRGDRQPVGKGYRKRGAAGAMLAISLVKRCARPTRAGGPSKSSSDPTIPRASRCYPGDRALSGALYGSLATTASPRTSSRPSPRQVRGYSSLQCNSSRTASQEHQVYRDNIECDSERAKAGSDTTWYTATNCGSVTTATY